MKKKKRMNRRSFVEKLTAGAIVAGTAPALLLSKAPDRPVKFSPNDTIRIGAIGMGIMGFNNCHTALSIPGVELAAVADLYTGRLERSQEVFGPSLDTYRNYAKILERQDIDAVIISTSDHWHDRISIDALNQGKAVYCEKPMVHRLEEGAAVIAAQQKTGHVFQVGSQRVSSIIYLKAKALYEAGAIGQLNLAEIRYDRHSALGAWQYSIPTDASETTVDWQNFLGDAPKMPFDPVRFFRWRNYRDYGTGIAGDLFVHLFSGFHLITGAKGPNRIYATGGLRYWKDGRDVPDVLIGSYDYPETQAHPAFNVQMRVNFVDGGGGGSHIKLIGDEGLMEITGSTVKIRKNKMPGNPGYGGWDAFSTFSESEQKRYKKWYEKTYPKADMEVQPPAELEYTAPAGYNSHLDHFQNFFSAIRDNKPVVEDAVFGFRAAGPALASNKSYFEKKIVNWDPEKMVVI